MAISFWVDVTDATGKPIGYGPLQHVTKWTQTGRLDRAGEFSFSVPLSERAMDVLATKKHVRCRLNRGQAPETVGAGIIDNIAVSVRNGREMIDVRGPDLMSELSRAVPPFVRGDTANTPQILLAEANRLLSTPGVLAYPTAFSFAPGWSLTGEEELASTIDLGFRYQSVLASLIDVTRRTGEHFALDGSQRQVRWLGPPASFESSGVLATTNAQSEHISPDNRTVALIKSISRTAESWSLINFLYVFGAGTAEDRVSLAETSFDSLPYGFLYDREASTIRDWQSIRDYGVHQAHQSFSDIRPLDATEAAATAASDTLMLAGYNYLRKLSRPVEVFAVELESPIPFLPGQTIRIDARRYQDGANILNIDEELYILEVATTLRTDGGRSSRLLVSNSDAWPETDQQYILDRITDINRVSSYPQLRPSLDTTSQVRTVTRDDETIMHYFLDQTYGLKRVIFRFSPLDPAGLSRDDFVIKINGAPTFLWLDEEEPGWFETDITDQTITPTKYYSNRVSIRALNVESSTVAMQVEHEVVK